MAEQGADGKTGVGEIEVTAPSTVEARGTDEDGDEEEHPPEEGESEEEDGEVAQEADGPEVVGGDLSHHGIR